MGLGLQTRDCGARPGSDAGEGGQHRHLAERSIYAPGEDGKVKTGMNSMHRRPTVHRLKFLQV